jgi:methionyl-tRNA synthetase
MWPAQLIGTHGLYAADPDQRLNLPYDVPANEFMNMEGRKISGSLNWGVWINDALLRHDPDPLRYYLTAVMPETRDSDWSWSGYVERNNTELVGNWGNLVNRVLNMTKRYFGGVVPEPGELTDVDQALLAAIDGGFADVAELYDGCKFRAVTQELLRLSSLVNQYLEETSPWSMAKRDLPGTGRTLYTALQAISALKVMWAPVLPFTSQAVHELLGEQTRLFGQQRLQTVEESSRTHVALTYDGTEAAGAWGRLEVPPGRQLPKPRPLFKKLEESVADEELARLGRPGG